MDASRALLLIATLAFGRAEAAAAIEIVPALESAPAARIIAPSAGAAAALTGAAPLALPSSLIAAPMSAGAANAAVSAAASEAPAALAAEAAAPAAAAPSAAAPTRADGSLSHAALAAPAATAMSAAHAAGDLGGSSGNIGIVVEEMHANSGRAFDHTAARAEIPMVSAGIRPELTAHHREIASHATRLAEPRLSGSILDYGAGTGMDTKYLQAKGYQVHAYDPHFFPEKPHASSRFDWALLNYVINVIPDPAHRGEVLKELHGLVKEGGYVLISVLKKGEIEQRAAKAPHAWEKRGDGWVRDGNLFEHGFTPTELADQLRGHGFEPVAWFDDEQDSVITIARRR